MSRAVILVALDGTRRSLAALPVARGLAAIEDGVVRVVHVGAVTSSMADVIARLGLTDSDVAGAIVDVRNGSTAEIARAAEEYGARYIVLCTHTRAVAPEGSLGRTALEVLHAAPCPVVFVHPAREPAAWRLRRILLPHDGSPSSTGAIDCALQLAEHADAELVVLHSAAAGSPSLERGALGVPRYVDQAQHEWPDWADEFLGRVTASASAKPPRRLLLRVSRGDASAAIVGRADAESIDLVVLGWHGRLDDTHARTLKGVLRATSAPVMIVRV